jgi:hypothetical protein
MPDLSKREALLRIITAQPEYEEGKALVKVCEFFEGNDDLGSIGCNLSDHPGLVHFQRILNEMERRSDVSEVWLQIYDLDEEDWPFSENVLVLGQISSLEVKRLCVSLEASEVHETAFDWVPTRNPDLYGRHYVNLWWD